MKHATIYIFLTLSLCIVSITVDGQYSTGELKIPETSNKPLKKDRSGSYYSVLRDSTQIVYFRDKDRYYKLLRKNGKLIMEGHIVNSCVDCISANGKWIEYYENGNKKSVKYYNKGIQSGSVEMYFSNGKLSSRFNTSNLYGSDSYQCMSGEYEEYYDNGQLKIFGFYNIRIDSNVADTIYVEDPLTGESSLRIKKGIKPISIKTGRWYQYDKFGKLENEESFPHIRFDY